MDSTRISVSMQMSLITCGAGHCYAVPSFSSTAYYGCPFCQETRISKLHNEKYALEQTIKGLRGTITTLKNQAVTK
jgi:hypothetical protein